MATMAFSFFPLAKAEKKKQDRLQYIQSYVEEAAAKERIEPALLRALIQVESNFNHKAVSRVGARGLMQIMPKTAVGIGKEDALDAKNPRANILAGAHYLRKMINEFRGDLRLAIAAYNAGPTAVRRFDGVPPYKETRQYVVKVFRQLEKERGMILSRSEYKEDVIY